MIVSAPLTRYAGYDWTLPPIILRCAGVPMNLTGMQIRGAFYGRAIGEGEPLTIDNGRITLDPDPLSGTISEVWIPAIFTADLGASSKSGAGSPRVILDIVDARSRARPAVIVPFVVGLIRQAAS